MARKKPEKIQITRRIRTDLWDRVQAHASSLTPTVTDTAVVEAALEEYLDRHENKGDKNEHRR